MSEDEQVSSAAARARLESNARAYLPDVLVDALVGAPERALPWIDVVDGTLVMADISGFTAMSERLAEAGAEGAEWLTEAINRFFSSMLRIARGHGADVLGFGGDAMLLLYDGEGHADRAVSSSIEMLEATASLSAFRVRSRPMRLSMSMGADSGRLFLAAAGLEDARAQYIPVGSVTRRAAEAESAARPGELIVTEATRSALTMDTEAERCEAGFSVRAYDTEASLRVPPHHAEEVVLPAGARAFLPPVVARSLELGSELHATESEHRAASIAFVNVTGVEALLAEDPERLADEVQHYVSAAVRLVERHGGYLVSNDIYEDGFKLVVTFGVPVAVERTSEAALRFAEDLRRETADSGLALRHRVGVNTGRVFAADAGPSYRRQYTVMGDAVNLAARLMSAATAGEVIVSEATATDVGAAFVFERRDPIHVKGKSDRVAIRALETVRQPTGAIPEGDATELVGRSEELAAAARIAEQVEKGSGRVVAICGEAGVGKSRLLASVMAGLDADEWRLLQAVCHRHERSTPYAPWLPVFAELLDVAGEDADSRAASVERAVRRFVPDSSELAGLLGPLFDAPVPVSDFVRSLDDVGRRRALFELLVSVLEAAAAERCLAVSLDNLQWADRSSVDFLEHLSRSVGEMRLLLGVAYRTDEPFELELPAASVSEMDLAGLPDDAAQRVLAGQLGSARLPEEAIHEVLQRCRGNPLFLQEVGRALVQSGRAEMLAGASGPRLEALLDELEIPDSIQPLIMARVDALEPGDRHVLRAAAVAGSSFDATTVRAALEPSEAYLADDPETFEALTSAGLIEPESGAAGGTMRFTQGLIQEVAYESLPFAARRASHRRVGELIEELHQGRVQPYVETLTHHFALAEAKDKTRRYAVKSAEKARSVFAPEAAVVFFELALEATRSPTPEGVVTRSVLLERMGDSYESAGHHMQAVECYRGALDRWEHVGGPAGPRPPEDLAELAFRGDPRARTSRLAQKIGVSLERAHLDYTKSIAWLDRALDELPRGATGLRSRICIAKGVGLFRKGEYAEALDWGRRGLELARSAGEDRLRAYALDMLASAYLELGDLHEAVSHDARAVELYESVGDLAGQAVAHGNLATGYHLLGRLDDALDEHRQALALYERLGNQTETAVAHGNIGEILVQRGELAAAIDHLEESITACRAECEGMALEGFVLLNLSRAYRGRGRTEEARRALADAIVVFERAQARGALLEAKLEEALQALDDGDAAAAQAGATRALQSAKRMGAQLLEARAHRILGAALTAHGDVARAEEHLRTSIDMCSQLGADYERGLALIALADHYAKRPLALLQDADDVLAGVGAAVPGLPDRIEGASIAAGVTIDDEVGIRQRLSRSIEDGELNAREYRDGCVLFREGDEADGMYVIVSGGVRLFRSREGHEIELAMLTAGDFFGEISLLDDCPRSATAQVYGGAELAFLNRDQLRARFGGRLAWNMLRELGQRLRVMNDAFEKLEIEKAERRAGPEDLKDRGAWSI